MAWLDRLWDKRSVETIIWGVSIPWADKDAKLTILNSHKTELVWCRMNDVLSYYGTLGDPIDKEALREFIAHNFSKKRYDAECDSTLLAALDPSDQAEIGNIFSERVSYFENKEDLEENYKKIISSVLEEPVDKIPEELIRWIINKNNKLLEEICTLAKEVAAGTTDATKKATLEEKKKELKENVIPQLKDVEFWIHGVRKNASWPEPLDFGEPLDISGLSRRSKNITSTNAFEWLWKRVQAVVYRGGLKEINTYLAQIKEPEEWLLLLHWLIRYKLLKFVVPNHATEGMIFNNWLQKGTKNRSKFKEKCDDKLIKYFEKISPTDEEKALLASVKARFDEVLNNYQAKMNAQFTP